MSATEEWGKSRIDCSETGERYPVTTGPNGHIVCPGCNRKHNVYSD